MEEHADENREQLSVGVWCRGESLWRSMLMRIESSFLLVFGAEVKAYGHQAAAASNQLLPV